MSIKIIGWPEGHPHLTKIDGYPFSYPQPTNPNPVRDTNRDGYASSFKRLYRSYKTRANKHGREFTLTEKDFYLLTSQPCFYCGAPPSKTGRKNVKNPYVYNGIDRNDGNKGYTLSNCFPCCWEHNDLKGNLSFHEFYRQSLAVVLSVSSKTALDIGDLKCIELLIELFPHVRFLKEHWLALLEDMRRNPKEPRFNWLLQAVRTGSK